MCQEAMYRRRTHRPPREGRCSQPSNLPSETGRWWMDTLQLPFRTGRSCRRKPPTPLQNWPDMGDADLQLPFRTGTLIAPRPPTTLQNWLIIFVPPSNSPSELAAFS